MYALACTVNVNDQEIGALVESRMDLLAVAPTQAKPLTIWRITLETKPKGRKDSRRIKRSAHCTSLEGAPLQTTGLSGGGGAARAAVWGPLVFSAITGGTQTQHWRGGGVGSSLISLVFLFTFQTGIVASHF